ncbi:MAG: peptidylprolyl isomerase [Acidimicrobiaceae bacterium]|nr:peptidylprolyl isomerase [Acidimicrobiaceae bacterium]
MAELKRAQHRRRNYRRGGIAAAVVVVFVLIAYFSTSGGGGGKKKTNANSSTTTATSGSTATTTAGGNTTTLSSTVINALTPRTPPAVSPACNAAPAKTGPTTTEPAGGYAVSIVPAPKTVPFPKLDGSSPRYTHFSSAPPFCIDVNKTYTATMQTDAGTMTIQLLPKQAPQTVNNFVFLAGYHYFDGIYFHRVIQGFVDQAGDPQGSGQGGPGYTIPDENPKSVAAYDNGALAMANTGQPHSGGSQFFIVVGNGGQQLSASYADFGQITSGLNVAKKINDDGSPASNSTGAPKVHHKILKVTITES